jgi:phospholipid transport system substrate-binding protein
MALMKKMRNTAMVLLAMLIAVPAWAQDDPKSVIETTVNSIIDILKQREDKSKLTEQDREAIREVVHGRFDYMEMSKRSLGREWRSVNEADRTKFADIFRQLLERSYGNRLAEYRDQRVEYQDAEFKGDKARVKTMVIDANKQTPVEYRLHQTPTGWQVYDIKIEGVSLVSTFRTDFSQTMDREGFAGLMHTLEKKVADLKAQDAA